MEIPKFEATPVFKNKLKTILKSFEDTELGGYVPTEGSGVTIATGFDIGQHSEAEIKNLGLSPALIAKLSPYTNNKNKTNAKNLQVTAEEAEAIDQAVLKSKLAGFERDFRAKHGGRIDTLDENTQLALASSYFNLGQKMFKSGPNPGMNKALALGDKNAILQQISNYHGKAPGQPVSRRVVEAAIGAGDVNITPESLIGMRDVISKDSTLRRQLTADFNKNRTQLQPTSEDQTDPSYQPTQRFEQIAPLNRVIPGGLDPSDISGIKSLQKMVGAKQDGDWGPNSQMAYDNMLAQRNQFAQVDPRRVDAVPDYEQMARVMPQETQYATMEDLLADRDLMGRSLFT